MPRCFACGRGHDLAEHSKNYEVGLRIEPPRCRHCNGKIRPGVVWFGESLPDAPIRAEFDAARHCGCLLSIGTSGVVQPAARIPHVALEHGATVIHINPRPSISNTGESFTCKDWREMYYRNWSAKHFVQLDNPTHTPTN
nr:Sir2 family NAD-dependent protein deacetylase [Pseudomonas sp. Q2-TVG4-2]